MKDMMVCAIKARVVLKHEENDRKGWDRMRY